MAGNSHNRELTADYVARALAEAEPYSEIEYFTILLAAAVQARDAGDYGVAAALVIRDRNTELISVGRNAVVSSADPLGHAEINAIRGFQSMLVSRSTGEPQQARPWTGEIRLGSASASALFFRPARPAASPGAVESLLYASLEPCPMCAVAIISSRIERVVVAAPDEQGGALAAERFAKLPPAWPSLAAQQGLAVDFVSPGSRVAPVPAELVARLGHVFRDTKDARDAEVSRGVLLHGDIEAAIADIAGGDPS